MRALLLYLFLLPLLGVSQQTYLKGYLVTDKGDTLIGEVKTNPKKEAELYAKVFFKDANGMQKSYKPEKTKGYGFGNRRFVAVTADGEGRYFEVLVQGAIGLYKTTVESTKMNETVFETVYYLSRAGETSPTPVKENKFKKQLLEFMNDNADIAAAYPEEKKFDPEKAVEVIKNYNNWKNKQY